MGRKGQITIFVIIGILIIIAGSVLIYSMRQRTEVFIDNPGSVNLDPLRNFVEGCLRETSKQGIITLGKQGRLYPELYMKSTENLISYFYYASISEFPTIQDHENELEIYIEKHLDSCVSGFSEFSFLVTKEDPDVQVVFKQNEVSIDLKYPLTVKDGNSQSSLDSFNARIDFAFLDLHKQIEQMHKQIEKHPEWIDLDALYNNGYQVRLIKIRDDTLVYEITAQDVFLESYIYRFAVRYTI